MHWAIGIGAHLADFAFFGPVRNDGFGDEFTCLVFRRFLLVFVLGLLLPDFDILVTWHNQAAFGGFAVGSRDLYQLGFRRYRPFHMRVNLGGIAGRIGTGIVLRSDALEEQCIVAGALGAFNTRTSIGHKRCIVFREWCGGKLQEDVMLDPFPQMANRHQDALCLAAARVALLPASGQCFLLLFWL